MNQYLTESIKQFVLEGIDFEKFVHANPNDFWRSLAGTSTEICLDSGDIDEASPLWCNEMTALPLTTPCLIRRYKRLIQ